jgi:hypothetical protein
MRAHLLCRGAGFFNAQEGQTTHLGGIERTD